ncbi:hypothetical protein AT2G10931 [Arabidopsis thaliana]|uniref:Uncharacterized protein n=2 Tax=Arabidopsis thaliana TaxID=3702 RepID=Q1PF83_ARATH|nr:uncharacterized protein AT2G10931 [Arabidopsis thaliana]ABE65437.1 unknown [Arabidopsis thaliana]AEC06156.1 hypothetical protein AT2G10931 [Arabidopsis thaliana]BAF00439.1 hypothetical protein [Arabidopsis thaliana]|eukprot:NP_001118294.1 hypothetical protein AT2G10931 [Arabidopsis thaliana]
MKVQEWAESILCQRWCGVFPSMWMWLGSVGREFYSVCHTVIDVVGCFSCSGSSLSLELRPRRKLGG